MFETENGSDENFLFVEDEEINEIEADDESGENKVIRKIKFKKLF